MASIERGRGGGKARQARKIPEILDCRKLAKVRCRTHHNNILLPGLLRLDKNQVQFANPNLWPKTAQKEFPALIFVLQSNLHSRDDIKLQCFYLDHELVSVYSQSAAQSNAVVYCQRLSYFLGHILCKWPVDCMRELQLASDERPVRKLSKIPAFHSVSD